MSVFKRFNGKTIDKSHPAYPKARWWMKKRINGKTIHQSIPEAQTRREAEQAERSVTKQAYDKRYSTVDTTITFEKFIETKYRKYVEQNNVNKGAKDLYIRHLVSFFNNKQSLASITAQGCRDCREALRKKKNHRRSGLLSPSSVNRIM